MTRFGYVMVTAVVAQVFAALFIAVALLDPNPRFIWNASGSAPIGLYRIENEDDPPIGALVAVMPPERLAHWLSTRGYLPEGVPLLKHVVAKAGQRTCRIGGVVSIDARPVAVARAHDSRGRSLLVWHGCRTLAPGEILLLNPDVPDSLDGRYFGPLPTSTLLGWAIPILTRDTPDAPLTWRGIGS